MSSIFAVQVSDRALNALLVRLSNVETGINPIFRQQAPLYNVPPSFLQVDFGSKSTNFTLGQIDPDQLEQTGLISYPFSCLYVLESANTNDQKFATFSGPVRIVLDIFLSWGTTTGLQNFEKYTNCVESTIFSIVNALANQNWGKPLVYNGGVQCRRGALQFAGENWRQKMGFSFLFGVHE